jgi:Ni,Fe-hydrogenase III component G
VSKKDNTNTVVEEAKVVENKQEANIEDVLQTLKAQLQEHQRQSEHHQTMAVKAQGALEVLLQLHPQEENNNK